jgi:hypothetical protein
MKKDKLLTLSVLLVFVGAFNLYSQEEVTDHPLAAVDTLQHDFGLFSKEDILRLTLRFDITTYKRKKPKEEYLNALLTYYINDRDSINKEVRLRSRGVMRNGYCDFPPISLNLKNSGLQGTDFGTIQKIKMVTHCSYGNDDYLFREYLIYKLYNALTDVSFRVRLVKIEYINTARKSKPIQTYAFLIEPTDMLAKRTNSIEVKLNRLTQKDIYPEMMDRMAIFNFMIGNTDWSVPDQHNCKVLSRLVADNSGLGMIVPYDFDYSGLVNATYAIPYEPLGLKSVRERRFEGICRTREVFLEELKQFTDRKDEFYRIVNEFPLISQKSKKDIIGYLDSFFNEFDKRNTILEDLFYGCKKF